MDGKLLGDRIMNTLGRRRMVSARNLCEELELDLSELKPALVHLEGTGRIRTATSKCGGGCDQCDSCSPTPSFPAQLSAGTVIISLERLNDEVEFWETEEVVA